MSAKVCNAMPANVAAAFADFPPSVRETLLAARAIIFETARETEGVGYLTETLKWGEPAYLTQTSGSGSTIRLGWPKARADQAAIYFNCRTTLVSTFREILPDTFSYQGNRSLLLPLETPLPDELRLCVTMALTYHQTNVR